MQIPSTHTTLSTVCSSAANGYRVWKLIFVAWSVFASGEAEISFVRTLSVELRHSVIYYILALQYALIVAIIVVVRMWRNQHFTKTSLHRYSFFSMNIVNVCITASLDETLARSPRCPCIQFRLVERSVVTRRRLPVLSTPALTRKCAWGALMWRIHR
jgi:hypothetical protein